MTKDTRYDDITLVAVLALAQAVLAVLRSLHWFEIGSDLIDRGIFMLPSMMIFAYARGVFAIIIVLLYVLFAFGELAERSWHWTCGTVAAMLNLLLVAGAIAEGESFLRAALWAFVPIIILWSVFLRPNAASEKRAPRNQPLDYWPKVQ